MVMHSANRLQPMKRYQNLSGNSGVVEYELGPSHIKVRFTDGTLYLYTNSSAGFRQVQLESFSSSRLGT